MQQLPLNFTQLNQLDRLEQFIDAAAKNADVIAASRNWVAKRGGDLHPVDIRQLWAAVRQVEGYGDWVFNIADFMDRVAYGVMDYVG